MTAAGAFPSLPHWLIAEKRNVPANLRPFGAADQDLAIDFRMARRPELITELLALCASTEEGSAIDREFLLDMPVGLRICALMALAATTDPSSFSWQQQCGSAECAQQNEFELSIGQIVGLAQEHLEGQTLSIAMGGWSAQLRRPTGRDQMRWLTRSGDDLSEAMVRTILVIPAPDELLADGRTFESIALAIDEAMDAFDPLPSFHLSVLCPQCGAATDVSPDLAGAALDRLAHAQRVAIADVHRLASRYHWSEGEILRLPQWRRQSYIELIEGGA